MRIEKTETYNWDINISTKYSIDVDGVLLNWEDAFTSWMAKRDYTPKVENQYSQNIRYDISKEESNALVTMFNDSAWMGWLRPLRDAVITLPKFKEAGYEFECITRLSDDYYPLNLDSIIYMILQNNIGKCICLEQGGDKDEILKEYEPGHWWIEDKPENCEAGLKAGHNVIIMSRPIMNIMIIPLVFRVNSWSEIFELITQGEHDDTDTLVQQIL